MFQVMMVQLDTLNFTHFVNIYVQMDSSILV